jgi:hypothetical protein
MTDTISIAAGDYTPANALAIIEAAFGGRDKLLAALNVQPNAVAHVRTFQVPEALPDDIASLYVLCTVIDSHPIPERRKRLMAMLTARYGA